MGYGSFAMPHSEVMFVISCKKDCPSAYKKECVP